MGERKKGEKMEDNFKVLNLRDRLVLACDANTNRIMIFSRRKTYQRIGRSCRLDKV